MIRSSLEFAHGTSKRTVQLAKALPAYDLLVAYRKAAREFNSTDIVLVVAIHDEEPVAFEAMERKTYVDQAFKRWSEKQRKLHPLSSQSAHQKMKMPVSSPAFWLAMEFRDKGALITCAVGSVAFQTETMGTN